MRAVSSLEVVTYKKFYKFTNYVNALSTISQKRISFFKKSWKYHSTFKNSQNQLYYETQVTDSFVIKLVFLKFQQDRK